MPPYTRKDDHGYAFVRPIPEYLQDQLGKATFIKRFGPRHRTAKTACAELAVATNRLIAEARGPQAQQDAADVFLNQNAWTRLKAFDYPQALRAVGFILAVSPGIPHASRIQAPDGISNRLV